MAKDKHIEEMSPSELSGKYSKVQERIRSIDAEIREIEENLPEVRIRRLVSERSKRIEESHRIETLRNKAVALAPEPERAKELVAKMRRLLDERSSLVAGTGYTIATAGKKYGTKTAHVLPMKYVRQDSFAHFGAEVKAAKAELEKLNRHYHRTPGNSPGGRTNERIHELESVVSNWEMTEKLCLAGERVFPLDQEIAAIRKELEEIRAEHRAAVLAG